MFKKYGYTYGCPGCEHKESSGALYSRGHSTLCRQRIYNRMKDDDEELDNLIKVDSRLRRTPPVAEQIRRPTEGEPSVTAPPAAAQREEPESPEIPHTVEEPMAAPADEEMSDPENRDEDDIRDVPDADLEEESNDTESEKEQERP